MVDYSFEKEYISSLMLKKLTSNSVFSPPNMCKMSRAAKYCSFSALLNFQQSWEIVKGERNDYLDNFDTSIFIKYNDFIFTEYKILAKKKKNLDYFTLFI